MASKTRLANKTIWALEDIIAKTSDALKLQQDTISHIRALEDYARRKQDKNLFARLAPLSADVAQHTLHISDIREIAREARSGEYNQPG